MIGIGQAELLLLLFFAGGLGAPSSVALGVPPGSADATLARVAPEKCLLAVGWNGVATPGSKTPNQTEQLFAEPEVQKLVAAVDRAILAKLRASAGGPDQKAQAEDAYFWGKTLLTRPTIFYISHIDPKSAKGDDLPRDIRAGLLVNVGPHAAKIRAALDRYQKQLPANLRKPVSIDGDTFYRFDDGKNPVVTWGVKDDYVGVAVGQGEAEAIVKRAQGEPPQWLTATLARLSVPRPSSLLYVDVRAWIETLAPTGPPEFRKVMGVLGLDQVTTIAQVSGLDDVGFVTRMRVGLEGAPRGIWKLLECPPLGPKDLAAIPADSHIGVAARFSAEKLFDTVFSLIGQIDPHQRSKADQAVAQAEAVLGVKIRDDLLRPLGDTVSIYSSPGDGLMFPFGLTVVVPLTDAAKLRKSHEKLLALVVKTEAGMKRKTGRIERTDVDGHVIYYFQPAETMVPFQPGWAITDHHLVASLSMQAVKAFVTRQPGGKSLAGVPEVASLLSGQAPLKIVFQNTPELFKLFYPTLQLFAGPIGQSLRQQGIEFDIGLLPTTATIARHLRPSTMAVRRLPEGIDVESHDIIPGANLTLATPVLVALLLPAVNAARDAARRAQSSSNMKQLMVATMNYETTYRRFPPAYTAGKEGKPLLSWRVHLLPFLDALPLYKQFHLDEPWDGPHNKPLVAKMPGVYRSPRSMAGPGKTVYLSVRGKDTIFPGTEKVGIADVRDGMSNTIALVEANDQTAVVWTKPDDYQPDPKDPLKGLRGQRGFNAAFADGSVHFISDSIKPADLKALFTRSGGEVVTLPGKR